MSTKKYEDLHKGHRQRMKAKMIKNGLSSLEPHEIMEIMLFFTNPRKDTNALGHLLIKKFGSIRGVLDASHDELINISGIGESTASHISFIKEIAKIYMQQSISAEKLDSPEKLCSYFKAVLIGEDVEQLHIVCLNHEMELVLDEKVCQGDIGRLNVDMRRLMEIAIKSKCDTVAIGHNHPKGLHIPSKADIQTTRRIYNAFANINIRLIDHIIIGINGETSIRKSGLMPDIWYD
ncbi:MAG: DNA repair protein RadC [Clostridiales bacterium]|nr:DNA repair protein RadC [Clostridiales bacterium]